MSQSIIDIHDRLVEAVNAREVPEELLGPGFRMEHRASTVTDRAYYGERGWREWMSDLFEVFAEGSRYTVEEVIAVGDDVLAATFCIAGHGRRSGQPLEFRWTGSTWFRGGTAIRAVGYSSRREALNALGLRGRPSPCGTDVAPWSAAA